MDVGSSRGNQSRTALPCQSLLSKLHTLAMKHFISGPISYMRPQIWTLKRELRLLQMVFMLLQNHEAMSEALINIRTTAEEGAVPVESAARGLNDPQSAQLRAWFLDKWYSGVPKFLETIDKKIKPELKEFRLEIVNGLLQDDSSREYDILQFIDTVLLELKGLEISRPNMIVPVKKQMEILEEMLHFVCIINRKEMNPDENTRNFLDYFGPWVNIAAGLVILYWVHEKDEDLCEVVYPSIEKFNLNILERAKAYIVVIKNLKPSNVSEILMMRETVGRFTNMVLENLIVSTDDHFEMLREGITLLIALLINPPKAHAEDKKLICSQINLLVDEAQRSLCLNKLGEDIAEGRNILINDFLEKMNKAKLEIRQLHVEIPEGFSWKNVPQTNRRGFFDFLLGNLQKKLESKADVFPFEKHLIAIVH